MLQFTYFMASSYVKAYGQRALRLFLTLRHEAVTLPLAPLSLLGVASVGERKSAHPLQPVYLGQTRPLKEKHEVLVHLTPKFPAVKRTSLTGRQL